MAERCTSLPYGDDLVCGGTYVSPLRFTGMMRDAETGLDDFPARYYSSGQGRWYSPDWASAQVPVPYADLHNPQSLNLYDYVGSDPTNHADADGHACTDSSTGCGSDQAKGAAVQASEGQAESKTAQNTAATTLPVALPSPLALPALEGVSDFALPLLPGLVALDYAVTVPPLEGAGDPMTPGYVSPPPSTSQQGAVNNSPMQSSRGQNVAPDPNAQGAAHSVAKRVQTAT